MFLIRRKCASVVDIECVSVIDLRCVFVPGICITVTGINELLLLV